MRENLTTLGLFATFMLAGCAFGLFFFAQPTPINVTAPPAPTPAVAPVDRDLVVGLSELLVDVNREAVETRKELEAVKNEARQIISAMVAEINRLRSIPKIKPGQKTCDRVDAQPGTT